MKILINSYPRSGTQTIANAIFNSMNRQNIQWGDRMLYNENWVHYSYIPVIFCSNFSDITLATITRDPVDAIASNVFRFTNGYTGNIVNDKIVISPKQLQTANELDDNIKNFINAEVKQYLSYYKLILSNHKQIIILSYDDIFKNPIPYIKKIISSAQGDSSDIDEIAVKFSMDNPIFPSMIKTSLFYEIKDYLGSVKEINECYDIYNKLQNFKVLI